ncbi:uncharacterized protein Pyn_13617 [Prunus yedoensis var. nudiflora]|uniref:Stress response protein NST1 n=1 Tax=Prunus yedoensis var. nudiflora TaxID=2094558 RepID=A0A315B2L0_PRUYE|nr:uncharacterized protein Pyn_13617 [Prunus yedoensis var. nudiflora]
MECNKLQPVVRKVKKKQVKDELDRQKQAEKKKRRLEKALATSAAIISELEKKKQKQKEEQQRLDEEGAAIAEAVALHVLLGEDSDETCEIVLNKDEVLNPWDCPGDIDVFMAGRRACFPYQDSAKCSLERIGWVSNAYRSGCKWGGLGTVNCRSHLGLMEGITMNNFVRKQVGGLRDSLLVSLQRKLFHLFRLQRKHMKAQWCLMGC